MHSVRHIAIILPDTLQGIAIRHLLSVYFPPVDAVLFSCFSGFAKASNEPFEYYIISSDTFVLHADYFVPRRSKTLVITSKESNGNSSGNSGAFYLYSEGNPEQIVEQLQAFFASDVSNTIGDNKGLSHREIDVLQLIVKGLTNKEIADKLNISLNTVLTHRKNITSKLGIKTVSGLTFYAIMNGLVSGDDISV